MKLIFLFICLSMTVFAEEVELPSIQKPAFLTEGTEHQIEAKELEGLLPWAKESRSILEKTLEDQEYLRSSERLTFLENKIKDVIKSSDSQKNELKMRYVLNRTFLFSSIIKERSVLDQNVIDALIDLYLLSIKKSLEYLNSDLNQIQQEAKEINNEYAFFGYEYAMLVFEISKSTIDASAQYYFNKRILEVLQYDLYRDLENKKFATQILNINLTLKDVSQTEQEGNDQNLIKNNRTLLKQFSQTIHFLESYFATSNVVFAKKLALEAESQKKANETSLTTKINNNLKKSKKERALIALQKCNEMTVDSLGESKTKSYCESLDRTILLRFAESMSFLSCVSDLNFRIYIKNAIYWCGQLTINQLNGIWNGQFNQECFNLIYLQRRESLDVTWRVCHLGNISE